jgi:tRNA threonylcarbamoyl adenosine modification protein YeaZ
MHSYIIINHTPETFEVALYINDELRHHHVEDKRYASKYLIFFIDNLLATNSLKLTDLAFIGVNQGPGLFSTLRSVLATVNGLHCASKVPLIGVDGLQATAIEFFNKKYPYNVTFLNAYNNEAYYFIAHGEHKMFEGCALIDSALLLVADIAQGEPVYCVGNAADMYQDRIRAHPRLNAILPEVIPHWCSTDVVKKVAYGFHVARMYNSYLLPLHLKKHSAQRQAPYSFKSS